MSFLGCLCQSCAGWHALHLSYVCACSGCKPQPALLVYLRGPGTWWLNSAIQTPSRELQQAYWTMGFLMAQAVTNRCTLGLPVAPLLFHLLLSPDDTPQVSGTWAGLRSNTTCTALPSGGYPQMRQLSADGRCCALLWCLAVCLNSSQPWTCCSSMTLMQLPAYAQC